MKSKGISRTQSILCGQIQGKVDINRGIFEGIVNPLAICIMHDTSHMLFMADLKIFGKSNEQLDSLVQTVHTSGKDIGIEFGIKKCNILVLKKTKVLDSDGIELPDGQITKDIEENVYKYIGV